MMTSLLVLTLLPLKVLTTLTTIVIALDVFVAQPTALETLVEARLLA